MGDACWWIRLLLKLVLAVGVAWVAFRYGRLIHSYWSALVEVWYVLVRSPCARIGTYWGTGQRLRALRSLAECGIDIPRIIGALVPF